MKEKNAEDIHKSKKTNQTKAQNNNKIRKEISQLLISESNNLEGWDEEGDGREVKREGTYVHLWSIHADTWQKTTKFCKAIILQTKTISERQAKILHSRIQEKNE